MTEKLKEEGADNLDYVSTLFKVCNHHLIVCLSAPMQVSGLSSMSGSSETVNIGNQVSTSAGVGTDGRTNACIPDDASVTELQNLGSSAPSTLDLQTGSNVLDSATELISNHLDDAANALLDLLVIGLPRTIGSADHFACLIRWKLRSL